LYTPLSTAVGYNLTQSTIAFPTACFDSGIINMSQQRKGEGNNYGVKNRNGSDFSADYIDLSKSSLRRLADLYLPHQILMPGKD
jgi:hypothetical protein